MSVDCGAAHAASVNPSTSFSFATCIRNKSTRSSWGIMCGISCSSTWKHQQLHEHLICVLSMHKTCDVPWNAYNYSYIIQENIIYELCLVSWAETFLALIKKKRKKEKKYLSKYIMANCYFTSKANEIMVTLTTLLIRISLN